MDEKEITLINNTMDYAGVFEFNSIQSKVLNQSKKIENGLKPQKMGLD